VTSATKSSPIDRFVRSSVGSLNDHQADDSPVFSCLKQFRVERSMGAWVILGFSIASEVAGTTCLKLSDGLTQRVWIAPMLTAYLLSLVGLSQALRNIEVGIAYAVWAGVGTLLVAGIGVVWFSESLSLIKIVSMALVVVGVIGLNLAASLSEVTP
jgi:small multidrug resistance pump